MKFEQYMELETAISTTINRLRLSLYIQAHIGADLIPHAYLSEVINFVGNISDHVWAQMDMTKQQPCGKQGCNCHEVANKFFQTLRELRECHKEGVADKYRNTPAG